MVELMERRASCVELVERRDPAEQLGMLLVLEQFPVDLRVVVPFPTLAELTAHEQQLLALHQMLMGEQEPQRGSLLPVVAGHLRQQGTLAMHDLVMGERQQESLAVGVHLPERELIVMPTTMHRIPTEMIERVVHPAEIPFEIEAEAPAIGGRGDTGPGSGLLGDHQHPGEPVMEFVVAGPQQ